MYRESADEDRSVAVFGLNGRVFGIDAASGRRLFEHQVGSGDIELEVGHGRVFAHPHGAELFVFEYPSGRQIGHTRLPGDWPGRATMLLYDQRLFVCTGGEVTCVNLDGQVLWHDPMKGKGVGSVAIAFPGTRRVVDSTHRA